MGEYSRLNEMLSKKEEIYNELNKKPNKTEDEIEALHDLWVGIGEIKGQLLEMADMDGLDDPYEAFDYFDNDIDYIDTEPQYSDVERAIMQRLSDEKIAYGVSFIKSLSNEYEQQEYKFDYWLNAKIHNIKLDLQREEFEHYGIDVSDNDTITCYHRTSEENALKIVQGGYMIAKENGLFFGSQEHGQIDGYGDTSIKLQIPIEKLEIDDVFDNEVHFRMPLDYKDVGKRININNYISDDTCKWFADKFSETLDADNKEGFIDMFELAKDYADSTTVTRGNVFLYNKLYEEMLEKERIATTTIKENVDMDDTRATDEKSYTVEQLFCDTLKSELNARGCEATNEQIERLIRYIDIDYSLYSEFDEQVNNMFNVDSIISTAKNICNEFTNEELDILLTSETPRDVLKSFIKQELSAIGDAYTDETIKTLANKYEDYSVVLDRGVCDVKEWIRDRGYEKDNGHMIIITPNDEVINMPCESLKSIIDGVDGYIDLLDTQKLHIGNGSNITVDIFINAKESEVDVLKKFDKVNAVATHLMSRVLRGNMVLVPHREDFENARGFKYLEEDIGGGEIEMGICETWLVEDTLMRCVNQHADRIAELHKELDRNQSDATKQTTHKKTTVNRE